jgi:hypothetical protein
MECLRQVLPLQAFGKGRHPRVDKICHRAVELYNFQASFFRLTHSTSVPWLSSFSSIQLQLSHIQETLPCQIDIAIKIIHDSHRASSAVSLLTGEKIDDSRSSMAHADLETTHLRGPEAVHTRQAGQHIPEVVTTLRKMGCIGASELQ